MYPSAEMYPRSTTHACRLLLAALLLPAWHLAAADEVDARLTAQEVSAGQPAELTLVATSEGSGQALSPPDLSALDAAFEVLDRQTQRRVGIINGRRREQITLRLLLMPKHAGEIEIEIPGISFGSARSDPLTLRVTGTRGQPVDSTGLKRSPPPPEALAIPEGLLAPGQQASDQPSWDVPGQVWGMQSPWASQWPSSPWPGSPFTPPGGGEEGQPKELPRFDPPRFDQQQERQTRPAADRADEGSGLWMWISLILAAALVASLVRRQRPAAPVSGRPAVQSVAAPPDPLGTAIERVREAYRRGDAAAARDGLLHWASLRWPKDPPNNLSRLAQRLQPPLRNHVTDLEKAFFSPEPIQWDLRPVADELGALARTGPEAA